VAQVCGRHTTSICTAPDQPQHTPSASCPMGLLEENAVNQNIWHRVC